MKILFEPISQLLKLQPHTAKALDRLGLHFVKDLILHKPTSYLSKTTNPDLSKLKPGDHIVAEVTIRDIQTPKKKGSPLKIYADNETGGITLIFFNKLHPFIFKQLRIGAKKIVEGKVELNDFYYQMAHPEFILDKKQDIGIEPIYPLTHSITNKQLHSYILKALSAVEALGGLSEELVIALRIIHNPKNLEEIALHTKKIAYFELLANQLSLAYIRKNNSVQRGRVFYKARELQQQILDKLGFKLSQAQEIVMQEIESDQAAERRMSRMLQGDVGSGKTLVALMTMLNVASQNVQSALMAPTDLLASQHFAFFSRALGDSTVALLTSKTKSAERKQILSRLESGEILMLIGTHSLFQSKVVFRNLGYVVIDEQHRFGVEQRLELLAKADNPDLLLMTATPIPRSLTLTLFGDMDVSRMTSKPANRPEIKTIATPKSKINDIMASIGRKIQSGEKVYWICPIIEQGEDAAPSPLADVISRFNSINELYPAKTGLLHGRMPQEEKDDIMQRFKSGNLDILISTTVIEVGIDVPDATLIIIENAERFGLAQLHQLRGRVGRGSKPSHCVLLYSHLVGIAKERIEIMRASNDGFYISEQDLKLRGGGEILGLRQSGQHEFRFADLTQDIDLLMKCTKEVEKVLMSTDAEFLMKIFDKVGGNDFLKFC